MTNAEVPKKANSKEEGIIPYYAILCKLLQIEHSNFNTDLFWYTLLQNASNFYINFFKLRTNLDKNHFFKLLLLFLSNFFGQFSLHESQMSM